MDIPCIQAFHFWGLQSGKWSQHVPGSHLIKMTADPETCTLQLREVSKALGVCTGVRYCGQSCVAQPQPGAAQCGAGSGRFGCSVRASAGGRAAALPGCLPQLQWLQRHNPSQGAIRLNLSCIDTLDRDHLIWETSCGSVLIEGAWEQFKKAVLCIFQQAFAVDTACLAQGLRA